MQVRRQNREGRDKVGAALTSAHVSEFWSCAQSLYSAEGNGTVFFLATDNEQVKPFATQSLFMF